MNKLINYIFITIIFGIFALNIIVEDKEFSHNENRYLKDFPKFTLESLLDGEFTKDIESYIQDQFISRDTWILSKALFNKALFKIENNNVYLGSDEYLFDQFIVNDYQVLDSNISYINKFSNNLAIMPIVSSATINSKYLSSYAYNTNELEILDYLKDKLDKDYIDVYSYLKDSNNSYFKTDHHWNTNGAYLGYKAYMEYLNIKPNEYTMIEVNDEFKGSMYSKSGMFYYDSEKIYRIKELDDYNIEVIYDKEVTSNSVYSDLKLKEKDKYTYYLDGNHAIVEIINHSNTSDDKLLVIKDSYAHIMLPYLVPHFKEVVIIDLRYYLAKTSDLIDEKNINNVLVLYSLNQLVKDNNLKLLR